MAEGDLENGGNEKNDEMSAKSVIPARERMLVIYNSIYSLDYLSRMCRRERFTDWRRME